MITELKKRPVIFNGVDGFEVLVSDDIISSSVMTCCDVCMYRDCLDFIDGHSTCMEFHGCGTSSDRYFIFYLN